MRGSASNQTRVSRFSIDARLYLSERKLSIRGRHNRSYDKDSFHISRSLSEASRGECQALVLARRHIRRYGDEQNWRMAPPRPAKLKERYEMSSRRGVKACSRSDTGWGDGKARNSCHNGFTIPELLVAMAVATILASVVVAVNLNFLGSVTQSRVTAELAVESHFALQTMIEDIRLADGIAAANTIADANQPGGWATSDTNNVLVLNSPAIDSNNDIIYDPDTGYPYRNQQIYFISGSTLYKRVLMNSSASGNIAKTTCPAALATSACPADKQYTQYISDVTFTFYDTDSVVTADPALTRSVKVGLDMSRKSFGKSINFNNSIRTTLRNY